MLGALTVSIVGALAALVGGFGRADITTVRLAAVDVTAPVLNVGPSGVMGAISTGAPTVTPQGAPTGSQSTPSVGAPTTGAPVGAPCSGEDCIPQPADTEPATTPQPPPTGAGGGDGAGGDSGSSGGCGVIGFDLTSCISSALTAVFTGIVTAALTPVLDLLGQTVLSTPTLDHLPAVGYLWASNWQIVLAVYVLFIIVAGILLMTHETVQTRYSLKEIGPRVALGFGASALSLFFADKAIQLANALAQAVLGQNVAPTQLGDTIQQDLVDAGTGSLFLILIGLALVVIAFGLLIVYVIRVIITITLIIAAPLFLMCHALPVTDPIARWWWRSFLLVLAIQVAQSLALVVAIRTVLTGGVQLFTSPLTSLGLLIIAVAMLWILFKIPFWLLRCARGGGSHRSLVGSLVRAFVVYKTFGMLGGSSVMTGRRLGTILAKNTGGRWGAFGGGTVFSGRRRPPAGGGVAGSAPLAAAGSRTRRPGFWRRSGRWIQPGPGMLPLKLRQPTSASTIGRARTPLASQLGNPARRMPWQQPAHPNAPALFSPQGRVNQAARPGSVRHPLIPYQPGMLPLTLRHADPVRTRRTLGDEPPSEVRPGMRPRAAGLFTSSGRVNPQALPPRLHRPLSPPQPGMLPFTLRPGSPARTHRPIDDQRPVPRRTRPTRSTSQPGLFMPDGRVNRNALPPKPTPKPRPRRRPRPDDRPQPSGAQRTTEPLRASPPPVPPTAPPPSPPSPSPTPPPRRRPTHQPPQS